MKKQMRKAMLSTMCMLVVGIMCLTGVTYAWFTTGNTATVNNFDVTVVSTDGTILVAMADPTSTSKLSFSGTEVTFSPNATDLTPVSTVNPNTNGVGTADFSFFKGTLSADGTTLKSESASASAGYWQEFTLYFYNPSETESRDLQLDASASSIEKTTTEGKNGADNKSQLATRIGFTTYTTKAIDTGLTTVPNTHNTIAGTAIVEPNAATHIDGTTTPVASYYGVKAAGSLTLANAGTEGDTNFASVTPTVLNETDIKVVTIPAKNVARVTVRIWVEGQDVDCQNEVAGYDFKVALAFVNVTTPTSPG